MPHARAILDGWNSAGPLDSRDAVAELKQLQRRVPGGRFCTMPNSRGSPSRLPRFNQDGRLQRDGVTFLYAESSPENLVRQAQRENKKVGRYDARKGTPRQFESPSPF